MGMRYWLIKSEPECYSIDDLKRDKIGVWDDIRNYQARNSMRDDMKKGDVAFFYQSSADVIGIVGVATIVKEAYPDQTQYDTKSEGYDAKATQENPRWFAVDVKFKEKFTTPLTLAELKNDPAFSGMVVTQKGSRLSVQPVSEKHALRILKLRSVLKGYRKKL
jgi:predicted RNA-binding protein with PUA-like domain